MHMASLQLDCCRKGLVFQGPVGCCSMIETQRRASFKRDSGVHHLKDCLFHMICPGVKMERLSSVSLSCVLCGWLARRGKPSPWIFSFIECCSKEGACPSLGSFYHQVKSSCQGWPLGNFTDFAQSGPAFEGAVCSGGKQIAYCHSWHLAHQLVLAKLVW